MNPMRRFDSRDRDGRVGLGGRRIIFTDAERRQLAEKARVWPAIIRVAGISVSHTCKRGPTLA